METSVCFSSDFFEELFSWRLIGLCGESSTSTSSSVKDLHDISSWQDLYRDNTSSSLYFWLAPPFQFSSSFAHTATPHRQETRGQRVGKYERDRVLTSEVHCLLSLWPKRLAMEAAQRQRRHKRQKLTQCAEVWGRRQGHTTAQMQADKGREWERTRTPGELKTSRLEYQVTNRGPQSFDRDDRASPTLDGAHSSHPIKP